VIAYGITTEWRDRLLLGLSYKGDDAQETTERANKVRVKKGVCLLQTKDVIKYLMEVIAGLTLAGKQLGYDFTW
jgi:hypothetical protein